MCVCVWGWGLMSQRAVLVTCAVLSQGVAASEEELRQTYMCPEEEEPADGFIQHDLLGMWAGPRLYLCALVGSAVTAFLPPPTRWRRRGF